MKKLTIFLLFFWGLTTATTCKKNDVNENTPSELRIQNSTPYTIYDCTVNPGAHAGQNFGQIDINAVSAYKFFDTVYTYGYVRLTMNNKTYQIIPIDYVGEVPFSGGRFTYKLTYDAANDRLLSVCLRD